ncbi:MAG: NUDIX domain-containing protein [Candidatus Levybacteria bacterium]|nr:NUDIX domain-containing protein [Candidatus Levybacteria bacterium]
MIDNKELVFVVDENNNPLEPQLRTVAHKNGLWHRTSGIWVINKNKQILCQKRSLKKDVNPGKWEAFFGGHLAPEEEYDHNAASEAGEELGIAVKKENLFPCKIFKSDKPNHKEFQFVFALRIDENLNNFNFEKDEIDQLDWISIEKVNDILVNQKNPEWVLKPWDEEVINWLYTL